MATYEVAPYSAVADAADEHVHFNHAIHARVFGRRFSRTTVRPQHGMAWTPMTTLNSSAISSVDYDHTLRTLQITFRSGRTYTLRDVPRYHYHGLLNASSPGQYFNIYLRGRY